VKSAVERILIPISLLGLLIFLWNDSRLKLGAVGECNIFAIDIAGRLDAEEGRIKESEVL